MKKNLFFGIALAVLAVLGTVMPVAALSIEVADASPIEVSTDLVDFGYAQDAGHSYTNSIKLTNTKDEAITVKLSTEKYKIEMAEESNKGADWLAFVGGKTVYTLEPEAETEVFMRYNIPNDVEMGRTQYAMVVISEYDAEKKEETGVLYKFGAKITLGADKLEYGGVLEKADAEVFVIGDGFDGDIVVRNDGKIGFESTINVRLSNAFGLEHWEEVYSETTEVEPGSKVARNYHYDLEPGVYKIEQKISYVNADGKLITSTNERHLVICPLWLPIAIGIVIVLVAVVIITTKLFKKNRKDKEKEELFGEDGDKKSKKKAKAAKTTKSAKAKGKSKDTKKKSAKKDEAAEDDDEDSEDADADSEDESDEEPEE